MLRVAIYFTPPPDSALAAAAAKWLGRDERSLSLAGHEPLPSLSLQQYQEIIAAPFHYGFHGTLKPPFRLKEGASIEQVIDRLAYFSRTKHCFTLPPLAVTFMHNFFCLRPTASCSQLNTIAAETVLLFDRFRQPPSAEELAGRRRAGLTARQETLLQIWGYPYVMDEFRFHLTLTGKIKSCNDRKMLKKELLQRFPTDDLEAVAFSSLALFIEEDGKPLRLLERFPLV
jgi:hypothetical protein